MFKLVMFDFDGVIIKSEDLRMETYKILFKDKFNVEIEIDKSKLIGKKQEENLQYLLDLNYLNSKFKIEELISYRKDLLRKVFSNKKNLIPVMGLFNFLEHLKDLNIKMVICSSSKRDYIKNILKLLRIQHYFDLILTSEDVLMSKPSPEIYLKAFNHFSFNKEECLIFEDSPSGLISANKARIKVIGLSTSLDRSELLNYTHLVFEDYTKITKMNLFWENCSLTLKKEIT